MLSRLFCEEQKTSKTSKCPKYNGVLGNWIQSMSDRNIGGTQKKESGGTQKAPQKRKLEAPQKKARQKAPQKKESPKTKMEAEQEEDSVGSVHESDVAIGGDIVQSLHQKSVAVAITLGVF